MPHASYCPTQSSSTSHRRHRHRRPPRSRLRTRPRRPVGSRRNRNRQGEGGAPALEHGAGAVANATGVKFAHAVVHIVAHPVAVQVVQAGVHALPAIVEVQARAVVDVGPRVEVARQDMDAPRVQAAAVVVVGAGVVVHRHGIRASAHHVGVKPNVEPQVVFVVALREHLHTHGAAHVAVGRQLGQEHPQVRPRNGVGRRPRDDRPPRPTLAVLHEPLPGPKHALPPARKQHRHPSSPADDDEGPSSPMVIQLSNAKSGKKLIHAGEMPSGLLLPNGFW